MELHKWDRPVPRYTSYPTAPQFVPMQPAQYRAILQQDDGEKPLSVYIHIPFCRSMCLFCGCSVVLNRNPERQRTYLEHLLQEIALVSAAFPRKKVVTQLHLGGGTPTSFTVEEFSLLMGALRAAFVVTEDAEISIEIDPRTVFADHGKKLQELRELGFNRVSFGVQDLDPKVQEAVKRRQSEEMTVSTYNWARQIGFQGINLDLMYGLPHQSSTQFQRTVERIIALKPDRVAFFSYAKVPWLKPHQNAIPDEALPSTEEKLQIYLETRKAFLAGGYISIGMDHFALADDPLAIALKEKKLMRNFQGYSLKLAEDMVGLGITSIGFIGGAYFQNAKTIETYSASLDRGELPTERGLILTQEDSLRRFVIESIMCHFEVDKREFQRRFDDPFDSHFAEELQNLRVSGLVEEEEDFLHVSEEGKLVVRIVASAFDAYLGKGQFSRAI